MAFSTESGSPPSVILGKVASVMTREHWRKIRTNNPIERIMRDIRRRTRVVGNFPDGNSALMLVTARLRYVSGREWGTKRYMNMFLLIGGAIGYQVLEA